MQIQSKLPNVGTTIFSVMSALANQHNAINLSQGFPNFPTSDKLIDLAASYMKKGYNQYAPMTGVPILKERIAAKIENMYGKVVHPDNEITITVGATQALFTAIATFVNVGDEVIVFEPAYDSYIPAIEVVGGIAVPYSLKGPDYSPNWEEVKALITPKTRMIIFNTPHNPTGTTLKAVDFKALEEITKDTNILLLSDEVYEHLIYDDQEHQSILRYPALFERSLMTYSFGKTFHKTGWRVGYCVAPPHLMKEFRKVHQFNVFTIITPIQYALADFLSDPNEYLSLNGFFQQKRDFLLNTLKGSCLKPLQCEGTYFCLFDYSDVSDEPDTAFAKRMTMEYGVASIPVSVFYSDQRDEKVIRLCFAKTEETLEKAGALLQKI